MIGRLFKCRLLLYYLSQVWYADLFLHVGRQHLLIILDNLPSFLRLLPSSSQLENIAIFLVLVLHFN